MIRRTSKIALEVLGVAVAATAVLLAVLAWRLSSGPIPLPILSQIIEDSARGELEGGRLTIGNTILLWSPETRQLGLRLVDVHLTGAGQNEVATIPELSFRLSVPALLIGRIAPTYIDIYDVSVTLVRRPEGISLGLAPSGATTEKREAGAFLGPLLEALLDGGKSDPTLGHLRHVGVQNATLHFIDEVNGVTFEAPNAHFLLDRGRRGISGQLAADVKIGETTSHLDLNGALAADGKTVDVAVKASNFVPSALARMSPSFANYAVFDAPLNADGTLDMQPNGNVIGARLTLEAGKGSFVLPGLQQAPVSIERARAELTLDAIKRRLDLKQLVLQAGPHSASLSGHVNYVLGTGLDISTARVDLRAGKTTTEIPGFFEGPFELDNARIAMLLDFDKRALDIEDITLGVAGGKISAAGTVESGPRSPAIHVKGTMATIPVDTVRAIWPLPVSSHAREWVAKNMRGGMLEKGDFAVDVPADMFADADEGKAIPDDSVHFNFNVSGAQVSYLDGMPPMTGVSARGTLQGNRFDAWVSSATVMVAPGKPIAVTNGHFADGELANKHSIGDIELTANAATADILGLLDHEPLKLIRGFGLDPSTIGGTGSLSAKLRLPLVKTVKMDDVDFSGTAHAEKVGIPNIQKDLSITDGTLDIDVVRSGLKAKGQVSLNGTSPLQVVWTESFVPTKGPGSSFDFSGTLNDAERTAIGLGLTDWVIGSPSIHATLTGKGANIASGVVHADLTKAVAKVDQLGWSKPVGKPATVDLKIGFLPDAYSFTDFAMAGEGIAVKGVFSIDKKNRILSANIPTVKLGPTNDIALKAQRDANGQLVVDIEGPKADARGLLHAFISGNGDKAEAERAATRLLTPEMEKDQTLRTAIRARIGEVAAQNDAKFTDLDARVALIEGDVYLMDLLALDQMRNKLSTSISQVPNRQRSFTLRSSDAGAVFRALDLFKGVRGGDLSADAVFDDRLPGSPLTGEISASKFRIANAPVLAKILTLGSLTGISDTLTGEGIFFDTLKLPFRVTGHRIHVEEARMSGPAIGLTLNGQIDRSADVAQMEGTLVPAYTVNSVLGKVPLLGPLIVGREGEGIFGFTYAVKGNIDNPSVIVNPLSAIAPGFLRRLFEFSSSLPPEQPASPAPPAAAPADKSVGDNQKAPPAAASAPAATPTPAAPVNPAPKP